MCGKYHVSTEEENIELREIIAQAQGYLAENGLMRLGDISPSQIAPVVTMAGQNRVALPMVWGFRRPRGKGLVINAKSETAATLPMFSGAMRARRCLIPASGFYEWNEQKLRHYFVAERGRALFMAGLYDEEQPFSRFVILTRDANADVSPVHPRMPYVLPSYEYQHAWLGSETLSDDILRALPAVRLDARVT